MYLLNSYYEKVSRVLSQCSHTLGATGATMCPFYKGETDVQRNSSGASVSSQYRISSMGFAFPLTTTTKTKTDNKHEATSFNTGY